MKYSTKSTEQYLVTQMRFVTHYTVYNVFSEAQRTLTVTDGVIFKNKTALVSSYEDIRALDVNILSK